MDILYSTHIQASQSVPGLVGLVKITADDFFFFFFFLIFLIFFFQEKKLWYFMHFLWKIRKNINLLFAEIAYRVVKVMSLLKR